MHLLRERLRETIPELAAALDRSWTIALDEWLAAMSPQLDSFNAYPHLRNHEKHLERIWAAYQRHHGPTAQPLLSPIELYVMLSSILFHDIGRTRTSAHHGEASKVMIEDHRAELGIPSEALAKTIARISRFHDLPPDRMQDELQLLPTTAVDPYGEIREGACAALLTLIDYMDGTVTRTVPEYIRSMSDVAPVGAFRRVIRDVEIDFDGQMVKVALGDVFSAAKAKHSSFNWLLSPDFKRYSTKELAERLRAGTWVALPGKNRPDPALLAGIGSDLPAIWNDCKDRSDFAPFPEDPSKQPASLFYRILGRAPSERHKLVARQLARASLKSSMDEAGLRDEKTTLRDLEEVMSKAKAIVGTIPPSLLLEGGGSAAALGEVIMNRIPRDASKRKGIGKEIAERVDQVVRLGLTREPWPTDLLLSMVLCNARENATALRAIRHTLWTIGIPVRAWLVEWGEHLFNEYGNETHEPVFSREDFKRIVASMIDLSTRIFGQGNFSYETLAAEIREPNATRAKRMVKRIGVVWKYAQRLDASSDSAVYRPRVLAGTSEWRLVSSPGLGGDWLATDRNLMDGLDSPEPPYRMNKMGDRP
jgi:hypothetical protein